MRYAQLRHNIVAMVDVILDFRYKIDRSRTTDDGAANP